MKLRLDYLNKNKEVRHTFLDTDGPDDYVLLGFEIFNILDNGGNDLCVYNITK